MSQPLAPLAFAQIPELPLTRCSLPRCLVELCRVQAMQRVMQNPEFLQAAESLGRGLMQQVQTRAAAFAAVAA